MSDQKSPAVVTDQSTAAPKDSNSPPKEHHHHDGVRRPHRSKGLPPDVIDRMDDSVPPSLLRHHSGPFDAVTRSAFLPSTKSPLAALQHSNEEALKATPESSIRDSLNRHIPLQNTAVVPPGKPVPGDPDDILDYKEENLIGDIGRWDGIEYDDDDRRAKGRHPPDSFGNPALSTGNGKHFFHFGSAQTEPTMIEMVPPERDVRIDGMQASSTAIEEAERDKHHGIVDGIKRRLSLKKHHKS
jgi:hypothetical protein